MYPSYPAPSDKALELEAARPFARLQDAPSAVRVRAGA